MTDYVSRTLEAYDENYSQYETSTNHMVLRPELESLVEMMSERDGLVLDAGCAYGRDMAVLHDELGVQVIGIDMSDGFLNRAKSLHPDFTFQKMDVRQLSFDDASFAAVWCNAVLLHLNDQDIQLAIAEFNRVLRDKGVLFLAFKKGQGEEEIIDKFSNDGMRYYNYKTQKDVQALLTGAGFQIERNYIMNEHERFGGDARDLDWVFSFAAKKPASKSGE